MNKETKPVKASSIRRAITTLSKAGFIKGTLACSIYEKVRIEIEVPGELIQPKKRIRKK